MNLEEQYPNAMKYIKFNKKMGPANTSELEKTLYQTLQEMEKILTPETAEKYLLKKQEGCTHTEFVEDRVYYDLIRITVNTGREVPFYSNIYIPVPIILKKANGYTALDYMAKLPLTDRRCDTTFRCVFCGTPSFFDSPCGLCKHTYPNWEEEYQIRNIAVDAIMEKLDANLDILMKSGNNPFSFDKNVSYCYSKTLAGDFRDKFFTISAIHYVPAISKTERRRDKEFLNVPF